MAMIIVRVAGLFLESKIKSPVIETSGLNYTAFNYNKKMMYKSIFCFSLNFDY